MPLKNITLLTTPGQFRSDFPEFTDKTRYSDSTVNYWIAVASLMLNQERWGQALLLGVELYVAHNVVMEGRAQDEARAGGWPGLNKGVISAQNAGQVSVNFDTAPTVEENAGHWNMTVYGTRFISFARMAGAGGIQIAPGSGLAPGAVPGLYNSPNGAWSGPPCLPPYQTS